MTQSHESTKDDPLYQSWIAADKIHRAAVKRYCSEFEAKVKEAKANIESELREKFRYELNTTANSVKTAFDAYCFVHREHPPQEMEAAK